MGYMFNFYYFYFNLKFKRMINKIKFKFIS